MTTRRTKSKGAQPRSEKAAAMRMANKRASSGTLDTLVERVVTLIEEAQSHVARAVNSSAVLAAWLIGREIVEFVQGGLSRADYGEQVLEGLSANLRARVGRGYSLRNLRNFRSFYQAFADRSPVIRDMPPREFGRYELPTVPQLESGRSDKTRQTSSAESQLLIAVPEPSGFSGKLGWSHYLALSKVVDLAARDFYEVEAASESWTVEHLERQIHTQLHLRLQKSRDRRGVMDLARRGQIVERAVDALKDPVMMDLFDLPHSELLRESDLETAIISKMSQFLLELGKGFAFVARQKRLTFEDEDFFVDLVFYNIILKCYLLVDLKMGKLTHQDVGQMDSYVRLFDSQGRTPGDEPTIGLILCAEKNEAIARYSILSEHKQLFAAKYVTYLPSVEELQRELERDRRIVEAIVEVPHKRKTTKPVRAIAPKRRRT